MFSVPKNGLEGTFGCFLFQKWFGTKVWGLFSSENGSERNSEVFSLLKMVRYKIPRFFSSKNGLEKNSEGSPPRNGSERNSKVFLFCETGGIPTELLSVLSCYVFRRLIFFVGKWQPYSHSWKQSLESRCTWPRGIKLSPGCLSYLLYRWNVLRQEWFSLGAILILPPKQNTHKSLANFWN